MLVAIAWTLLVASAVGAGIYKWVDEKGNVHYGDCPPPECAAREVPVAPAPPADAVRETRERIGRPRGPEGRASEDSDASMPPSGTVGATPPAAGGQRDVECFAPLGSAWGGRIADAAGDVVRKPLTKSELRHLTALFRALEGHWKGTIARTVCVAPDASPTANVYKIDARLEGRWVSDDIFRIEANLLGRETHDVSREFLWFLLSPDGLRARMATSDISADLDRPRYDVAVLESGPDRLLLYSRGVTIARGARHRGSVRMTTVFSLQRTGRGFAISDFLFSQGTCAEKRIWNIRR
jgi:hypothetical protein